MNPSREGGRPLIRARGLTKRYGSLTAVDSVDFDIYPGQCFGFLGPNGAGKTTILRMISCVSPVTRGHLTVDGLDVRGNGRSIKARLGVVSQADSLDPDLNVLQNLVVYAAFFGVSRRVAQRRAREALELFHLSDRAADRLESLSGGMRRRLLIARALLHRPRILILDEPTTALDPQSRHMVWERLALLKERGITLLLTTHNMEEAARLCDRLVVMDHGRVLVEGSPEELVLEHVGPWVVELRPRDGWREELEERLRRAGVPFDRGGRGLLAYPRSEDELPALAGDGLEVHRRPANLEDLFLRLTGRGLRDQ